MPPGPLDDVESTPLQAAQLPPGDTSGTSESPAESGVDADAASGELDNTAPQFDPHTGRLKRAGHVPLDIIQDLENEPRGTVPEGAWQKAWEEIQQMPAAEPPADEKPAEPDSWLGPLGRWFASLWEAVGPRAAWAQSYQWTQIGPAPFLSGTNANVGFASEVAIVPGDPNMNSLFAGTLGGIFKTTNGGQNWTPVTDDQATPRIRKVVIHPTVTSAVFGGSGIGFITWIDRPAGVFRSLQSGAAGSWCKIGPAWPPGSANDTSSVAVYKLVFDSTGKLYAATDRGLFYTTNSTTTSCNGVTWTPLSKSSYNSTGLPMRSDGNPEIVTGIGVGAWSNAILYASLAWSPNGNNGVYRSTNSGSAWTKINGSGSLTLPSDGQVEVLALTPRPSTANQDVLYALVSSPSHPAPAACPTKSGGYRLYKAKYGSSFTGWARTTSNKQCTTAADCCEVDCACTNGWCQPAPDCANFLRSVAVSPTDENVVALGAELLYRSANGGGGCSVNNQPCTQTTDCPSGQTCVGGNFMQYGRGVNGLHDDMNDLTFASDGLALFIGTDGGVWKSPNFGNKNVTPSFQNINGDMANALYYHGALAPSNHSESVGGMQDNGETKGGNTTVWYQLYGGDGFGSLVDQKNYNVIYTGDLGGWGVRAQHGRRRQFLLHRAQPQPRLRLPTELAVRDVPGRHRPRGQHRPHCLLGQRTQSVPYHQCHDHEPEGRLLAVDYVEQLAPDVLHRRGCPVGEPPSTLAFGAGYQSGVWRTTNATTASTWTQSTSGLPTARNLTSFAFPLSTRRDVHRVEVHAVRERRRVQRRRARPRLPQHRRWSDLAGHQLQPPERSRLLASSSPHTYDHALCGHGNGHLPGDRQRLVVDLGDLHQRAPCGCRRPMDRFPPRRRPVASVDLGPERLGDDGRDAPESRPEGEHSERRHRNLAQRGSHLERQHRAKLCPRLDR